MKANLLLLLLCTFITLVSLSCKSKCGEPKTDQKTEKIEIEIKYIISTGYLHTCAIDKNDSLWCWGDNKSGQLGDGTNKPSNIPKMIMQDASQVEMGANHTCAIKKRRFFVVLGRQQLWANWRWHLHEQKHP